MFSVPPFLIDLLPGIQSWELTTTSTFHAISTGPPTSFNWLGF